MMKVIGRIQSHNPYSLWVVCRGKHFISSHQKEKIVYVFLNTSEHTGDLPHEYNVCDSTESFKIKSLKGGFQRRPELIAQCERNHFKLDLKNHVSRPKSSHIQMELTEMALYLIDLFQSYLRQPFRKAKYKMIESEIKSERHRSHPKYALDIGCGMGVSMIPLINNSYISIGTDLNIQSLSFIKESQLTKCQGSPLMFSSSSKTNSSSGIFDLIQWDLRHGLPFNDNTFDFCISISFLQWLFYGQRQQQLNRFFSSLHRVVCPGGKAVIQFYPRSQKQLSDAVTCAESYFKGVLVGDYPHVDRGRKLFLLLYKY